MATSRSAIPDMEASLESSQARLFRASVARGRRGVRTTRRRRIRRDEQQNLRAGGKRPKQEPDGTLDEVAPFQSSDLREEDAREVCEVDPVCQTLVAVLLQEHTPAGDKRNRHLARKRSTLARLSSLKAMSQRAVDHVRYWRLRNVSL